MGWKEPTWTEGNCSKPYLLLVQRTPKLLLVMVLLSGRPSSITNLLFNSTEPD